MKTGYFMDGLIPGLSYRTEGTAMAVGTDGSFSYPDGGHVTFLIGQTPIGTGRGKQNMTPLDFYMQACRLEPQYSDFCVLNTARILLAAAAKGADTVLALEKIWQALVLADEPEVFSRQKAVRRFLRDTGTALPSCSRTRNIMRRCESSIHLDRHVEIPLKDGRHVNANVYRPIQPGRYPVIMCMGAFGSGFINGFRTEGNAELLEEVEDRFYSEPNRFETQRMAKGIFIRRMLTCVMGSLPLPDKKGKAPKPIQPKQVAAIGKIADKLVVGRLLRGKAPLLPVEFPKMIPVSSAFEQPAPDFWVPNGYVVIHVEEYGQGDNPGDFKSFGGRNAHDFCEAIEWAAEQPWSSGKVGLMGASYYAMTQYTAAQFHPKGLAAMIPIMGDADAYRDYNYSGGGLYNRAENFDTSWPKQAYSNLDHALEHPLLTEEGYGPEAAFCASADVRKIDCPMWGVLEPMTTLHSRGTSEAYIHSPSKNKKLSVIVNQGIHFWMYEKASMEEFKRFFDCWLKGEDNGIMDEPPVMIQMATGNGSYYVRREADWPVPGTVYQKLYLAAGGRLLPTPQEDGHDTYRADVDYEKCADSGVTYTSAPMERDMEIAGNAMADMFAASSTDDMELHISVKVLLPDGRELVYQSPTQIDPRPVIVGALKASHRALDRELTRTDSPFYLHTKEACGKLTPDEVVECPVGTFPSAFRVPKGARLQLRIAPVDPVFVAYDSHTYRPGAVNKVYYGKSHPSYLQIPVLPCGDEQ